MGIPEGGKVNSQVFQAGASLSPLKNGCKLILSVDDEPVILSTREKVLRGEGYEVLSAVDGEKALQMFAASPPDLVLLDYVMPGVDGGIIAQQIKGRNPRVPIIMVSANQVPSEALTCVDCFVSKGQGPALLLQQIRHLLEPLSDPQRCD